MKKFTKTLLIVALASATVIAAIKTIAQIPPPVLTITPLGTNQFSISFTNTTDSTFDLQGTPILNNSDYPWTWAAIGIPGQSNFVVTGVYETSFYQAILDTNSVPLWEAANPNNPSLGPLTIYIDSPTNGSTLN